MEQTNTPQQPSRKKAILSLLVLLALTCVVVFIFSSHWAEISTALAQLSLWQVLLVLAIGLTAWMPPLWAPLATWSAWVPGPCPWSPTTSTTAAFRWAPVWA